MVHIETSILCENCDYTQFVYNDECYYLSEKVDNFVFICVLCEVQCCINCTLRDTKNKIYCERCYWQFIQKGLVQSK